MLEQTSINMPQNILKTIAKAFGIQPGEGLAFVLLAGQAFFLGVTMLCFYTTANSLFLSVFESSSMPYVYIATAFAVVTTSVIFTQLKQRLPISTLLVGTQGVLLASIIVLWVGLQITRVPWLIFMVMIGLRLFWAYGNFQLGIQIGYLFNVQQGKRLYALILSAPVFAIIIISLLSTTLINLIGITNLLLVAATGMIFSIMLLFIVINKFKANLTTDKNKQSNQAESQFGSQLKTLLKNRFVLYFFAFTVISTFAFNALDYAFITETGNRFKNADDLGQFFGNYLGASTLLLLIVALATPKIFKRYGLKGGILINPIFVGIGGLITLIIGGAFNWAEALFWLTALTKLFDDGSVVLNNSRRNLLYQPLPDNQRVTLQTMVESVIIPISTALVGVMLLIFQLIGNLNTTYILILFLIFTTVTIISGISLNKSYTVELKTALLGRHLTSELNPLLVNKDEIALLQQELDNPQPSVVIYALTMLTENSPNLLPPLLPKLLAHPVAEVRQGVLEHVEQLELTSALPTIQQQVMLESEPKVRGAALRTLAALGRDKVRNEVFNYLDDPNVEVRMGAMIGLLRSGGLKGTLLAGQKLLNMVEATNPLERITAAQILGRIGVHTFYEPIIQLLNDNNPQVQRAAIIAAGQLKSQYLWPLVIEKLKSSQVSNAAVSALISGGEETLPALETAFNKPKQSPAILILITRIFARIRGEEAIDSLEAKLNYPNPTVRTHILYALSRCRYRVKKECLTDIEEQIDIEISHATWLLGIVVGLQINTKPEYPQKPLSFLQTALINAINQARTRIFYLLSFIYDSQAILRVRDIIEYPLATSKQQGYALEMIDVLISSELKEKILPLLTTKPPKEQLKSLKVIFPQPRRTLEECLHDLITASEEQTNNWLKACAIYAAGSLAQVSLANNIKPILTASAPLLRETTIWTLNELQILKDADLEQLNDDPNPQVVELINYLKNKDTSKQKQLSTIERILFLKDIDLFEQLPAEDLVQVAQVAQKVTFSPQETILKEGDIGDCLYIIITGDVQINVKGVGQIAALSEKNVIGEMSILANNHHRTASILAITKLTALKINREDFQALLAENPELSLGIFKVLVQRLERISRKAAPLSTATISH